jgi:hypothetical protein
VVSLHRRPGHVTHGVNGVIVRRHVVLVKEFVSWFVRTVLNRRLTGKRNSATRKTAHQLAVDGHHFPPVQKPVVVEFNIDNEIVRSLITFTLMNSSSLNHEPVRLNHVLLRGRIGVDGSHVQHRVVED